jgi:arginase
MNNHKRNIEIIGFPSDLGANIRGSCMAPMAIRIADLNRKLEILGYKVNDRGDVTVPIRESLHQKIQHNKFLFPINSANFKSRKFSINSWWGSQSSNWLY